MIKVKTFSDYLAADIDSEMEDYIADKEIKKENIITVKFYCGLNPEDNFLYHYAKLVYDNGIGPHIQIWYCSKCGKSIRVKEPPTNTQCTCGSRSWGE